MLASILIAALAGTIGADAALENRPATAQLPPVIHEIAPDPAALQIGRSIASKMFAPGIFERLAAHSASPRMTEIETYILYEPLRSLLESSKINTASLAGLDPSVPAQAMRILDPSFEQRIGIALPIVDGAIVEILSGHEPQIRENLARFYAALLTIQQLNDLDRFLQTPSGSAYAAHAAELGYGPVLTDAIQSHSAEIDRALPGIMRKVQTGTAAMARTKTAADLNETDRSRLAQLLHVSPNMLGPQR